MLRTTLASSRALRVCVFGLVTVTTAVIFTGDRAEARRSRHHQHARHQEAREAELRDIAMRALSDASAHGFTAADLRRALQGLSKGASS